VGRIERSLIFALASIKGAAAAVNGRVKVVDKDVARAIEFLAGQGRRGISYELQLTAAGRAWVP